MDREKLEDTLEKIHKLGALDCDAALAALRSGLEAAEALKLVKPGRRQQHIDPGVRAIMEGLARSGGRW